MIADIALMLRALRSPDEFYLSINTFFERHFGEHLMLHFPLDRGEKDGLLQSQRNLTDFCIAGVLPIDGLHLLEIGCGNGVQSMYVHQKHAPASFMGIDIDPHSISLAIARRDREDLLGIDFAVADAQNITTVADSSMDVVMSVESAAHYADKQSFLQEVARVLKPGGRFVIADRLTSRAKQTAWERRLHLYYWSLSEYVRGFDSTGLTLEGRDDFTKRCVRGLKGYRNWLTSSPSDGSSDGVLWRMLFRLATLVFARAQVRIFKSRSYWLFVGSL